MFSKSVNEIKKLLPGWVQSNNKERTCVPGMPGDSPLYVEMVPSDTVVFCTDCDAIAGRHFRLSVPPTHVFPFEQTMRFTYLIVGRCYGLFEIGEI